MKILNLRVFNLAALVGEHFIDFEAEPLKNAGLIAITGATGAGKSTLLDAICLALFDQVARLQRAEGKLQDVSGDDIQINSSVNVLRRGCTQGFAEVAFIAQDAKTYVARWEVKRSRLKVDGRLQAVQRSLHCKTDDSLISERTKECNERIIQLLGLNFSQFTRAVLLAQSEVGAFLKAKDNERADLLEYLTNSDIYTAIGKLAFDANKRAKETIDKIQDKIGDAQPLAELERQQLLEQQQLLQQQYENTLIKQVQCKQQIIWYEQTEQFSQVLLSKRQHWQEQQQRLTHAQPDIELLTALDIFEPIRQQYTQAQQTRQKVSSDEAIYQQKKHAQQQLDHQIVDAKQALNVATQHCANQEIQREQAKPSLQQAQQYEFELSNIQENLKTQLELLRQTALSHFPLQQHMDKLRQQAESLAAQQHAQNRILLETDYLQPFDAEPQASIKTIEQAATLRQQLLMTNPQCFKASLDAQQQQLNSVTEEITGLQQSYNSIEIFEKNQTTTRDDLKQFNEHLANYERLSDQLNIWQTNELQQQENQSAALQLNAQLAQQRQQLEVCTKQVVAAEIGLNTTQQLLAEQRLIFSQSVEQLRAQLQVDQACMVCGSTQHPYQQHHVLQDIKQQFDDAKEAQAKAALKVAQHEEQQLKAAIASNEIRLGHAEQNIQKLITEKLKLLQHLQHINSKFYRQIEPTLEVKQAIATLSSAKQILNDKIDKSHKLLEQQSLHLNRWRSLLEQQLIAFNQIEKRKQLLQLEEQFLNDLPAQQQQAWQHDAQASQQIFCAAINQRKQANQSVTDLARQLEQTQQALNAAAQDLSRSQQDMDAQQAKIQHTRQLQSEKKDRLEALFNQHASGLGINTSQAWQQYLEQQISKARKQQDQASMASQALANQAIQLEADIGHIKQQIKKQKEALIEIEQMLSNWQSQYPDFDHALIERLLSIDLATKQSIQQRIQQLKDQLLTARNTLEVVEQQLAEHTLLKPQQSLADLQHQLSTLSHLLQTQDQQRQEFAARLIDDNRRIQASQTYKIELGKAQNEYYRWHKIHSVIGDAQGTTFKKIAQEYHLQILVQLANQQLAPLSTRYELRTIPDSLGLLIVDHDMNDEVRPVLSLSGGETFLVSLALALGIAAMASGSTKLESLFIDEGFGTLDPASLHMVMDALDRLQDQGRKVVLISHIQDMHERIPVKIQVIPQGAGASKIEIVG